MFVNVSTFLDKKEKGKIEGVSKQAQQLSPIFFFFVVRYIV
jgi:hypothetical protein